MNHMLNIAVAGATGYAGAEALRLLLSHPGYGTDFTIGALTAGSNAGQRFGDLMPQIPQLAERTVQATTPETLEDADAVILALPHGVSAAIASKLPPSTKIIDCGADFRLEDADAWAHYYGTEHAGTWTYGIPELPGNRETIASSTTIAAPGCFPTGATLAAAPGVVAGVIEPELTIVSITGVSGAGKKAAVNLIGAETMGNLRAYGVGTHRHTPEIAQNIRNLLKTASSADTTGHPAHTPEDVHVTFTPVLAPLTRGILTTVTAPLSKHLTELPEQEAAAAVRAAYEAFCAPEHFLHLLPAGQQPETKHVQGTNMVHLQVEVVGNAVVVTSAIDNLTKGTAGAAVQCLNLMYGWPEHAGLPQVAL